MDRNQTILHIQKFLINHYQMVIATNGDHPWIATVYFSFDEALNLYFLSDPNTIHGTHIATNPNVSISVASSPQNPSAKKKGLQMYGTAELLTGKDIITPAITLWKKTLGVTSDLYTYEGIMKNRIKGRMYKVIPLKMKFFNEELWEEGSEPIISFPFVV